MFVNYIACIRKVYYFVLVWIRIDDKQPGIYLLRIADSGRFGATFRVCSTAT